MNWTDVNAGVLQEHTHRQTEVKAQLLVGFSSCFLLLFRVKVLRQTSVQLELKCTVDSCWRLQIATVDRQTDRQTGEQTDRHSRGL